jgi:membrane protease subunit HflK
MRPLQQILVEYNKAPEVTRSRLYLETMQQVYSNTSKVMVDAKGRATCSTCRSTS